MHRTCKRSFEVINQNEANANTMQKNSDDDQSGKVKKPSAYLCKNAPTSPLPTKNSE